MNRRRLWASLLGCLGVTFVLLAINLALGNTPALGLDLQGGVSVVLAPEAGATDDDLLVIRDLIRDELENRGIGEPDVRVEGSNIVVDLPGVKDQRDALDAVDVAGIVTLRPVIQCFGAPAEGTDSSVPGIDGPRLDGTGQHVRRHHGRRLHAHGSTSTAATVRRRRRAAPASAPATRSAPASTPARGACPRPRRPTTSPTVGGDDGPGRRRSLGATPESTVPGSTVPTTGTTVPAATPDTTVLRTIDGGQCVVGPAGGAGDEVFSRDSSNVELTQDQGWTVVVGLSPGGEVERGTRSPRSASTALESCPSRQLAIVLDDVVQSAPTVNEPEFSGSVSISGSFTEGEARSLSRVLNRGAFPTQVEVRRVDTVSPTLGKDSLRASIFAGLVGIALLVLVLVLFYRRLTLLIAAGMIVWGMLIYSVSVFISETDELRPHARRRDRHHRVDRHDRRQLRRLLRADEGRGPARAHVPQLGGARASPSTWRTILAANLVSFIAAAVLFVLSVGSVRGFALYLGRHDPVRRGRAVVLHAARR